MGEETQGKESLMSIPLSPNQAAGRRPQWFLRLCKGYRAGGAWTTGEAKESHSCPSP